MKKSFLWLTLLTILSMTISCTTENDDYQIPLISNDYVIPETKDIEIEILEIINEYRQSNGLNSLIKLGLIKSQTYVHTDYMIEVSSVSHDNFSQRRAFLKQYAGAIRVSENVAYGYNSPESVVNAWINSDEHREAIEGDYTHFDISAEQDEDGYWYYTNIFVVK